MPLLAINIAIAVLTVVRNYTAEVEREEKEIELMKKLNK